MTDDKAIAILLTDQFANWEFGALSGPGVGFYGRRVVWVSPEGGDVRSMGGLWAMPGAALESLQPEAYAALVVIGGNSWVNKDVPEVGDSLRAFHAAGAVVAGICGGTVALARNGLLNDVSHTSDDPGFLAQHAPGYRGQARYRTSASAVRDGQIITAPGSAPASFAAEVLAAAGLEQSKSDELRQMLAAEHR